MTNIQAIDLLKGLEQSLDDYCELNDEGKTAFGMAITALELFGISEQLPSAQPDVLDTNVGDIISRQAAIDALGKDPGFKVKLFGKSYDEGRSDQWFKDVHVLTALPSAQPERKQGKWIYGEHDVAMCDGYRCDKCGFFVPWDYQHKFIDFINDYHFCPSCGADMRPKEGGI